VRAFNHLKNIDLKMGSSLLGTELSGMGTPTPLDLFTKMPSKTMLSGNRRPTLLQQTKTIYVTRKTT
jgi:hypothetical protein